MSYINTMFTGDESKINKSLKSWFDKSIAYFKNISKYSYEIGSHKEVIEMKEFINAELLYFNWLHFNCVFLSCHIRV